MGLLRTLGLGILLALAVGGCSHPLPFAEYQQAEFAPTQVTASTTQIIKLQNPSADQPQVIRAIGFDAGGNPGGNFQISKVVTGGRTVGQRDIIVPAGGTLEIHVAYAPRDLDTTQASFGSVVTGEPVRVVPQAPAKRIALNAIAGMQRLAVKAAAAAAPDALHRALLILTYVQPTEGVMQLELIGHAVPGPNGETALAGAGDCEVGGSTACFTGVLRITLPGVVDTAQETELSGKWALQIDAGAVRADMARFPVALFVISGDQVPDLPVSSITIAISGDPDTVADGTFSGQALQIDKAAFRVRIFAGSETVDSITDKAALIDFVIRDIAIATTVPLSGNQITLAAETTLSAKPTGIPLGDDALGGKQVKVEIAGELALP